MRTYGSYTFGIAKVIAAVVRSNYAVSYLRVRCDNAGMAASEQPFDEDVRTGNHGLHPVQDADPEMMDAPDSELDVVVQTTRDGEWIEWSGPICWIPGDDGGSL